MIQLHLWNTASLLGITYKEEFEFVNFQIKFANLEHEMHHIERDLSKYPIQVISAEDYVSTFPEQNITLPASRKRQEYFTSS
ncbi:hypothetical protein QE152_g28995 [Popillia japonica]|uniref:Uncharacterized protein n=1 Tax=Popillia japonica TaxID=7064 RepID=A0AAW1JKP9_POPJA